MFCVVLFFLFFFLVFCFFFFFFNDTATTEIYTLSLHDALPISPAAVNFGLQATGWPSAPQTRSEEHTSELQSRFDLVCRLLLEKKKKKQCVKITVKKKNNKKKIKRHTIT